MTKKERFEKAFSFLRYEGVVKSQSDAAAKMGASRSSISSALGGNELFLTDSFLMRFATTFKQISLDWLLKEEGPMLTIVPEFKSENTPHVFLSEDDRDVIEEQANMTARIMELVHHFGLTPNTFALKANIEVSLFHRKLKGQAVWSVADVHKICDTFKIRKGWLVDGTGQQARVPEEYLDQIPARRTYDAQVGVPYYNVDFKMGYDLMMNDQTVTPEYMIDFAPYNRCDCWCNASGDSMRPTISNGDKIALKEIPDPRTCLISGEIYAIVTTNDLRTIKRVHDNGETITLIADNKEYPEQTISKDIILKVYKVLGCVKVF